jgi:plastocyanin
VSRLLALVVLLLATTAGAARAVDHVVTMPGLLFDPSRLSILVGDTVTWTNDDTQFHTATASDGRFDSGFLGPGQSFSHTFTAQGTFAYVCTIHRFMRGEIDVFAIALSASVKSVRPGGQATLSGRAPAEVTEVTIEAENADGSFSTLGTAATEPDGSFSFTVSPSRPTEYRAVAGELESPTVLVSVSAAVRLLRLGTVGRAVLLKVTTSPAQPRAPVVLERYAPERFAWVRVRATRTRLNAGSEAFFRYVPPRRAPVRAVLVRGVNGYGPGVSPPVWLAPVHG